MTSVKSPTAVSLGVPKPQNVQDTEEQLETFRLLDKVRCPPGPGRKLILNRFSLAAGLAVQTRHHDDVRHEHDRRLRHVHDHDDHLEEIDE